MTLVSKKRISSEQCQRFSLAVSNAIDRPASALSLRTASACGRGVLVTAPQHPTNSGRSRLGSLKGVTSSKAIQVLLEVKFGL